MSCVLRKLNVASEKTKTISSAISAFVFSSGIVIPFSSSIGNFQPQSFFCHCTGQFESDLGGNPEDQFSHDTAYMSIFILSLH